MTLRNLTRLNLCLMVNIACAPTVCPHVPSSLEMLSPSIAIPTFKEGIVITSFARKGKSGSGRLSNLPQRPRATVSGRLEMGSQDVWCPLPSASPSCTSFTQNRVREGHRLFPKRSIFMLSFGPLQEVLWEAGEHLLSGHHYLHHMV